MTNIEMWRITKLKPIEQEIRERSGVLGRTHTEQRRENITPQALWWNSAGMRSRGRPGGGLSKREMNHANLTWVMYDGSEVSGREPFLPSVQQFTTWHRQALLRWCTWFIMPHICILYTNYKICYVHISSGESLENKTKTLNSSMYFWISVGTRIVHGIALSQVITKVQLHWTSRS